MTLDEIVLTDFGLYSGRHSIALAPPSSDKPVILFGGLNGGGKTTLLDALQLCLFGPHAKTSNRGRLGYLEYLSRCIHNHTAKKAASIELRFRHTIEGTEDRYALKRSWANTNGRCTESFDVLKNGRLAPFLADNWAQHVQDLIPTNIAHLFLFDGEQIERYASPSDSTTLVSTAIQNLLGIDIVDQLEKDIRVFERRKKSEQLDDDTQAKMSAVQEKLQAVRTRIDSTKQEQAALRTHKIEQCRRALRRADDEFRQLGGSFFEQRKDIEADLINAEFAFAESSKSLRELASSSLPFLLVHDIFESAAARDHQDQDIVRARQLNDLLYKRDTELLAHAKNNGVSVSNCTLLHQYLETDRRVHEVRASRDTLLDLSQEARNSLTALLEGHLNQMKQDAEDHLTLHSKTKSNLEQAKSVHHNVPQLDSISEVMQRREKLKSELAKLEVEDASIAREIQHLQRERERNEQSLDRLLEASAKNRERNDDVLRMVQSASKVRETLAKFRTTTIEAHVERIEHLVLESYQHLLRKTSLVTRLTIDPRTFSLTLFGRTGEELPSESLSAGERQLLGIALLWGLAKASGRPLPTAIDTPLGRLDTEHRRHFVEHYVPFASHQTLLFSTNEEIVGDYLERLNPSIGRFYFLNHDDQHGCTKVTPGYFEGEEISNGH